MGYLAGAIEMECKACGLHVPDSLVEDRKWFKCGRCGARVQAPGIPDARIQRRIAWMRATGLCGPKLAELEERYSGWLSRNGGRMDWLEGEAKKRMGEVV